MWGIFMRPLLIVEDEIAIRDMLTELIGQDGREIVTASDGQEALERLTEVPRPCLILLDLMMPRMNGWEFYSANRPIHRSPIFPPSFCRAQDGLPRQSTSWPNLLTLRG
jgi:CheY-like chemotaxis protein